MPTYRIPSSCSKLDGFSLVAVSGLMLLLTACSSSGGGSESASTTNASGVVNGYHLVSSTTYDEFDVVIASTTYEYNLTENEISIATVRTDFDGNAVSSSFRNRYNEKGQIVESISPSGNSLRVTTYEFNERDLLVRRVATGEFNETTEFEYNDMGNLIRVVRTNEDDLNVVGYVPRTVTYTYNELGQRVSALEQVSFPDSITGQVITTEYSLDFSYNDSGQLVRRTEVNLDSSNDFIETYAYDDNGNVVERVWRSEPIERTTYTYGVNPEPIYNHWLRRFKYFP